MSQHFEKDDPAAKAIEQLRAKAANALADQTMLKGMSVEDGAMQIDVVPPREIVIAFVKAARAMLGEAPNYSETPVEFPADSVSMDLGVAGEPQRYVFTVQRAGKVTPHQARRNAEAERDTLAKRLGSIGERLDPCSPPSPPWYGVCSCGYGGSWPCPTTEAAWIARGLNPQEQAKTILADMRPVDEK